jgi:hypothetical protein
LDGLKGILVSSYGKLWLLEITMEKTHRNISPGLLKALMAEKLARESEDTLYINREGDLLSEETEDEEELTPDDVE